MRRHCQAVIFAAMSTVKHYLSLVKFSHTIFALPFALVGFFLGLKDVQTEYLGNFTRYQHLKKVEGLSDDAILTGFGVKFLLVLACMLTARSAAMAFNRYLDRHFDAKNPRTAIREIPAGIISAGSALRFTVLNAALFVVATYFINPICFYLGPVALFVILFYSYTKRFTALCHLVLGVGLSLAPIGAYLAVVGQFALLPVLFSLTVLFWVSGFDIIFALQDEAFDRQHQLRSIPAAVGVHKALSISRLLHVLSAGCVVAVGVYGGFGWLYGLGALGFCSMLVYQHRLVKPHDLSKVNLAFMTANGIASVVFAVFVIADLLLRK
jgi:4-hydroxybenzoate polyprenyltransferase